MTVFSIAALSVCYAGAAISRAVIVHVTTTATACQASAVTFMGNQTITKRTTADGVQLVFGKLSSREALKLLKNTALEEDFRPHRV